MAFLDNSGDIILDAVLTDTGRYRLAQGDGSFKIAKFAVADDEINYGSFNNTHASGSAYYDLEILQTPILEGFTDNGAMMKSKLMSISQNNILYMPILMLNERSDNKQTQRHTTDNVFLVTVDKASEGPHVDGETTAISTDETGVMKGFAPAAGGNWVRVDQGINTTELSKDNRLTTLEETQYIIEIDNRLGIIANKNGDNTQASFIDDDDIASYYFNLDGADGIVTQNTNTTDEANANTSQIIAGPRGTTVEFKIRASLELRTSTYLFSKIGVSTGADRADYKVADDNETCANGWLFIDTMVRVIGATTGYRLDVPVRFIKRDTTVTC